MDNKEDLNINSDIESLSKILLDRYWYSYEIIDERRRKAFLSLYYSLTILAIIYLYPEKTISLQFVKIPLFTVLSVAPFFICFSSIRYLYLCAHSLDSYITYLKYFEEYYSNDLEKLDLPFNVLYTNFQRRDFSEHLNIFYFTGNIKESGLILERRFFSTYSTILQMRLFS